MRFSIAWAMPAIAAASVTGCSGRLSPPTPPLLLGAATAGSWDSHGCPAHSWDITARYPEAHSPRVEDRLTRDFPAGTPEADLLGALTRQGFKPEAPCDNDPAIHRASFNQSGGGLAGPYPALAEIAWKVDPEGRIAWTKANVMYTGP